MESVVLQASRTDGSDSPFEGKNSHVCMQPTEATVDCPFSLTCSLNLHQTAHQSSLCWKAAREGLRTLCWRTLRMVTGSKSACPPGCRDRRRQRLPLRLAGARPGPPGSALCACCRCRVAACVTAPLPSIMPAAHVPHPALVHAPGSNKGLGSKKYRYPFPAVSASTL